MKGEFIQYPPLLERLKDAMNSYSENYLPVCGGSVDVVHVKWSSCPTGDYNHHKGKEGFPSITFEVISGYDRQILAVSFVYYGTRNDQDIVKLDENVAKLKSGWYGQVEWESLKKMGWKRLTPESI
jgi:hypothetical protein